MVDVAYGCCVGSVERFERYVAPVARGRRVYTAHDQASITVAYNGILDAASENEHDMLIMVHDDLEILDPDHVARFAEALADPAVAVVGVAGGHGVRSLAWWEAPEVYGHQLTDSGMLELGPRTGDVESLEGSVLVFSPWAITNLRYDERLTGFNCCDEAVIGATRRGRRVTVVDVDTHHHTRLGFRSNAAHREWLANDVIYRERWNL